MSDSLRQVDEDLRKDRLLGLWKKYGNYIIGIIVILILSVIGYQINFFLSQKNSERIVEMYLNAVNSDDVHLSINNLAAIDDSDNTFIASLAKLRSANLHVENGNLSEGRAKLKEIINNEKNESIITDLAIYLFIISNIDEIEINEINKYLNEKRISTSEFKYLFEEIIAVKELISGNYDRSLKKFENLINDNSTPNDILVRAEKFIKIIK